MRFGIANTRQYEDASFASSGKQVGEAVQTAAAAAQIKGKQNDIGFLAGGERKSLDGSSSLANHS